MRIKPVALSSITERAGAGGSSQPGHSAKGASHRIASSPRQAGHQTMNPPSALISMPRATLLTVALSGMARLGAGARPRRWLLMSLRMPQRLAIDIREPAQASKFPKHGWASNSQGYRLLWLPVLTLVRADGAGPGVTEASALQSMVENLCITLRELHGCQRRVREKREAHAV
jgi:hypothetical protein